MQGATFDEFKTMLAESWEIDYLFGDFAFHYQRSGCPEGFAVYLACDGNYVYQRIAADMRPIVADLLALRIYDGMTVEEVEGRIRVLSEA